MSAKITHNDFLTKTKKLWNPLYHKNYLINDNIHVTMIINKEEDVLMFENAKPAQLKPLIRFTRKDRKDFQRSFKAFYKNLRDNVRYHEYQYNDLEIHVTIYPGKQPTIQLTTDYFPHTFSSDPTDVGLYSQALTWANLQGCWNSDEKMYDFVTTQLINYQPN